MPKTTLTPDQQKKLLLGILIAAAVAAWLLLVLLPRQGRLAEARSELQLMRGQMAQWKEGLAKLPLVEKEIGRLAGEFQLPENPKPPEEQLPELLEEIAKAARRAQIQVVGQKPKSNLDGAVPGTSGYLEIPIFIMVTGGYHQIGQFLDDLEASPHLLRLREMGMIGRLEDPYRHQALMLFEAYLVPGAPERLVPFPPAAAGGAKVDASG